jgi:hypothetical protein
VLALAGSERAFVAARVDQLQGGVVMAAKYTAATFRTTIIDPTLVTIGLYSPGASDLLLGTAVHESGGFKWVTQMGGGPARGYFQMEGATHDDCWDNYLKYHKALGDLVKTTLKAGETAVTDTMTINDPYAAAMARIKYRRVSEAIPAAGDLPALAKYWKKYYNTPLGAGTTAEFIENWNKYVTK